MNPDVPAPPRRRRILPALVCAALCFASAVGFQVGADRARAADHGEPVRNRDAFGAGEERELDHLPIELGYGDGFLGRGGFVEFGAKAVPGNVVDVKHRSLAILHE